MNRCEDLEGRLLLAADIPASCEVTETAPAVVGVASDLRKDAEATAGQEEGVCETQTLSVSPAETAANVDEALVELLTGAVEDLFDEPDELAIALDQILLSRILVPIAFNLDSNMVEPGSPLDQNDSGTVTPLDVLIVLRRLNDANSPLSTPSEMPSNQTIDQLLSSNLNVVVRTIVATRGERPDETIAELDLDEDGEVTGQDVILAVDQTRRALLRFADQARFDVNQDGRLSTRDALTLINALSRISSGISSPDDARFDVNGDGQVSAEDALVIINRLREAASSSAASTSGAADGLGLLSDSAREKLRSSLF